MSDWDGARVVPVDGAGTEDVLVDEQGRIYTGLADRRIIRIDPENGHAEVIAQTPGRPLGLEFHGPDELAVCASDAGLLSVRISTGQVHSLTAEVAGEPLLACNNSAVTAGGAIYFTDSSRRHRIPQWRTEMLERTGTGRLLRRDPDGTVEEILDGLQFANGVALAPDESFLIVAETTDCRVDKVWLTGPRAGQREVFADDLPGYPDNCSTGSDGLLYVAIPSPKVAALGLVHKLPAPLRRAAGKLPESLQPAPVPIVTVLAYDVDGRLVREHRGRVDGFRMLTGVRERAGTIYCGSLQAASVVVL